MSKSLNSSFLPLQKGYFRKLGGLHLHVDSRDVSKFAGIGEYAKKKKLAGKPSTVTEWIKGSQFHKDAHSAPGDGPEHFITLGVNQRSDAVEAIKHLLELVQNRPGVVVEAERVMSCISTISNNSFTGSYLEGQIYAPEVGFQKSASAPVEIHHCFELPKSDNQPFTLDELCSDLESEGLKVRTWSLFDKSDTWSFHSTLFAYPFGFAERCAEHFQILCRYLRKKGLNFSEAWVVSEEVLGIWQTPLSEADDEDYPNRVSVETLIGTPAIPMNLAGVVEQCRSSPTRAIAETDPVQSQRIIESLSVFEGVVRSRELDPILIELSINADLPVPDRGHREPADRCFAAHIVSYLDTPSFPVIRAWQEAVARIVGPGGLQIDPIVSHSETYKCGFLFSDLRWWAERAYSDPARGAIPQTAEHVGSLVARSIHSESDRSIKAGCRRVYPFDSEKMPAPVDNTIAALSRGFVSGVVDSLRTIQSEDEADVLVRVLNRLLSSYLLVVPFRWPSNPLENGSDKVLQTTRVKPGGCLFVVMAPSPGRCIDMEKLKNTSIRLGWLLFRAALEAACPADSFGLPEDEPAWEIKLEAVENHNMLKKALAKIGALPSAERLQHLERHAPFLANANEDTLSRLRRALSAEEIDPTKLRWKILAWHHKRSRATINRWKKEVE